MLIHTHGLYEELLGCYEAMQSYFHDHGLSISGAPREFYLSPPGTPADQADAILEWPIA